MRLPDAPSSRHDRDQLEYNRPSTHDHSLSREEIFMSIESAGNIHRANPPQWFQDADLGISSLDALERASLRPTNLGDFGEMVRARSGVYLQEPALRGMVSQQPEDPRQPVQLHHQEKYGDQSYQAFAEEFRNARSTWMSTIGRTCSPSPEQICGTGHQTPRWFSALQLPPPKSAHSRLPAGFRPWGTRESLRARHALWHVLLLIARLVLLS